MRHVGGISEAGRDTVHEWTECRENAWMYVATVTGLRRALKIATSKLVPPTGDCVEFF